MTDSASGARRAAGHPLGPPVRLPQSAVNTLTRFEGLLKFTPGPSCSRWCRVSKSNLRVAFNALHLPCRRSVRSAHSQAQSALGSILRPCSSHFVNPARRWTPAQRPGSRGLPQPSPADTREGRPLERRCSPTRAFFALNKRHQTHY